MSLLDEIVAEYKQMDIPDEAFTAQEFADNSGLSPSSASKYLLNLVRSGRLQRRRRPSPLANWEYVYWEADNG